MAGQLSVTVRLTFLPVKQALASSTRTKKVKVPACCGVPLMVTPLAVLVAVKPVGRLVAVMVRAPVPPVEVKVCEKGWPTVASGIVAGLNVNSGGLVKR